MQREKAFEFEKVWIAKRRVQYGWKYQQLHEAYWKEFEKDASEWLLPDSTYDHKPSSGSLPPAYAVS